MMWLVVLGAVVVLVGGAPYWLPGRVVALRVRIFAWVNGDEGIPVPGNQIGLDDFRRLYAHPAANGRSKGAVLSDLFWYWLAPGPQVHQEHLEPGPRYEEVARATRTILAAPRKEAWDALATRCTATVLDELGPTRAGTRRLRDLMMPVWAAVYYELVFGEPCPPEARELIVANADDVVSALKCTRLRHMGRRDRLTRYLVGRIQAGTVPVSLPGGLSTVEQAWYLQGTFFNTAVVQMSEAMAHLLLVLAAKPDPSDVDGAIDETFRRYPLFGVAHRVTTADIALDGLPTIPAGSVLLFNYPAYHHAGYPAIPFGVSANRPCPARGVAPLGMRAAAREVLRRYALASSAGHTRSLPNRGPALLIPVGDAGRYRARLAWMRVADRWADVWRSLVQLVLGSYMVWDARRLGLCRRYFADQQEQQEDARCPLPN